jgi:hypothetical protein
MRRKNRDFFLWRLGGDEDDEDFEAEERGFGEEILQKTRRFKNIFFLLY